MNRHSPDITGRPAPELKIKEGLKELYQLIESGGEDAEVCFHLDFMPVLQGVLSKLIDWTEKPLSGPLAHSAGRELAQLVRFLSAQESAWSQQNPAFGKMVREFGDKRGARLPESSLSWLAVSTFTDLVSRKRSAELHFLPIVDEKLRPVDVLNLPAPELAWLKRLNDLPEFNAGSWEQWAEAVYDKMTEDEEGILARPEMKGKISRDCERRKGGKPRLYDWKKTITEAIERLSRKPTGSVPGLTRPI